MSQEERRSGGGLSGPRPDPNRRNEVYNRPVGGNGRMLGSAIIVGIVVLAVVAFLIYEALN